MRFYGITTIVSAVASLIALHAALYWAWLSEEWWISSERRDDVRHTSFLLFIVWGVITSVGGFAFFRFIRSERGRDVLKRNMLPVRRLWPWLLVSSALFAVSLALPAGRRTRSTADGKGIEHYLDYGWEIYLNCFQDLLGFWPWLANPALWLGMVLLIVGRWKAACIAGWVALVIGAAAGGLYAGSFGGIPREGYYLWMASFGVLTVGAYFVRPRPQFGHNPDSNG